MDAKRAVVLQALGIERFVSRTRPVVATPVLLVNAMERPALVDAIRHCQQCALASHRTQAVVGSGALTAAWFIVAEAPDREDDQSGDVLTGRAGALLTSMLRALGLTREQVFISTAVKCVPTAGVARVAELAACSSYLHRQIVLQQPTVVLCLGERVAQSVLGAASELAALRGQVHALSFSRASVVVTHALVDVLKQPLHKRAVWADLQLAADVVHGHSR